ncbi:hypothetical protein EW145_g768 [Phellinidium pouzarii]|uniref:Uncharacterized protein n=1 Tax=Phellinidium pouzarii TaxID=167371 RepID=A0A4S4LHP3_9AGAM|nr:hypothetical protein EW145_g768 [Phellinidium pouzarii]
MASGLFNVEKQLVFYGAFHSNKVNIRLHMLCVPLLLWTFQVVLASFPTPSFFPAYRHDFNSVLSFEFDWATVQTAVYLSYFLVLLPSAAATISLLSAIAVSRHQTNVYYAIALHVVCWLIQFYGHGVHERRSPALLDNAISAKSKLAIVLAPFFVHLKFFFMLGYFPTLFKTMQNGVDIQITKFRRENAQAKGNT